MPSFAPRRVVRRSDLPRVLRAQISVRCCGTTVPERTAGPCWQLSVVMIGRVDEWPVFTWPTSAPVPTTEERTEALASLGFTLAEGAEWEWCEDTTPEYHPHPSRVSLMAAAQVRPVNEGARPPLAVARPLTPTTRRRASVRPS